MNNEQQLTECMDIIYTHEYGQDRLTIPLVWIPNISSKSMTQVHFEQLFNAHYAFRDVTQNANNCKAAPRLAKISCCIYSKQLTPPKWYIDCNGKFYYHLGDE